MEKVYEKSLLIELKNSGLFIERQKPISVYDKEQQFGEYNADLIVSNSVIIEIKASEALCEEHEFQLINYLKAIEIEFSLLLNSGKKPQIKRKIYANQ